VEHFLPRLSQCIDSIIRACCYLPRIRQPHFLPPIILIAAHRGVGYDPGPPWWINSQPVRFWRRNYSPLIVLVYFDLMAASNLIQLAGGAERYTLGTAHLKPASILFPHKLLLSVNIG
jgi:hypothetical protein